MKSYLAAQSPPHLRAEGAARWAYERDAITHGRGALGPIVLLLAAFCAVIVFFPPEGRIAGPLHQLFGALLGRATFMLPVTLAFVGVVMVLQRARPDVILPRPRLAGVALIAIAVAACEQLIANGRDGTGLIGAWLSTTFLDLFGGPLTTVLLVVLLGVGTLLAFDVKWPKGPPPRATPDAAS